MATTTSTTPTPACYYATSVYYKRGEYNIAELVDEIDLRTFLISEIGDHPTVPCYAPLLRGVSRTEEAIKNEEELDEQDILQVSKNAQGMSLPDLVKLVIQGGKYIVDHEAGYGLVSVIHGQNIVQRAYRDANISFSLAAKLLR